MPESTLSLTYAELIARVGLHIGYTRTSTNWSAEEALRVDQVIRDGLRRFYGERDWTFLKPYFTLDTEVDVDAYELPAGIGYIEGNLFFDSTYTYQELKKMDAEDIIRLRRNSVGSSIPLCYALRPKGSDGTIGQANEIILFPTPSEIWTLTYKGRLLPDMLTTDRQYALGGMAHSQTILEACLAAADLSEDDAISIHEGAYQQSLTRSIGHDARAYAPRSLGYNANRRGPRLPSVRQDLTVEFDQ